jgi:soluble cytochrome b562
MKISLLASALLISVLVAGPALRAQDAQPAPAPDGPRKPMPKTELAKDMDKIGDAIKTLQKQVGDPAQNVASLKLVATIRDAAQAATKLAPEKAKDLPEADRPGFVERYRDGLKEFLGAVDQLDAALRANDNATATAIFKQLGDLERKDHIRFRRAPTVNFAKASKEDAAFSAKLLTAIEKSNYAAFVADGTPEFKGLTEDKFNGVAAQLAPKFKAGYSAAYLGELMQHGFHVTLWKVSFADGSDDALATLVVKQGKVAGFWIQ